MCVCLSPNIPRTSESEINHKYQISHGICSSNFGSIWPKARDRTCWTNECQNCKIYFANQANSLLIIKLNSIIEWLTDYWSTVWALQGIHVRVSSVNPDSKSPQFSAKLKKKNYGNQEFHRISWNCYFWTGLVFWSMKVQQKNI